MQKTNFPFEVLIHDDASTDGTADIIRKYEQKYPKIIKPIYQTENQHSKGVSISRTYNFPRIKGKYFAICEGDDYWIDKYKLQKQVNFMEDNDEFSICFHPVKIYIQNKHIFKKGFLPDVHAITDIKDLALINYIHTPSVMYRTNKQVFDDLNKFPVLKVGDYLLHMLFAKHGKIIKLSGNMAVYRIHNSGTWSMKNTGYTFPIWLKLLEVLLIYFSNDLDVSKIIKEQYLNTASSLLDFYIDNNDFDSQNTLLDQINNQFPETSLLLFNALIKNLKSEIQSIKESESYRIGRIILSPLRAVKYLWKHLTK
jgi:glycosyltransferase involved in cell wall biosynthesis